MTVIFTPTTRTTRAILMHTGDLRANLYGSAGAEFADVADANVPSGSVPSATTYAPGVDYVPPDASVIVSAGYDELVVDVQPTVRADGSVGVASAVTQSIFRQIAMTDRPYWIVVRVDGYGVVTTRNAAMAVATAVLQWAVSHAASMMMLSRLSGFAFVCPDLNVVFPDHTTVDRLFQNTMIMACWSAGYGAMMVTSRPADVVGLIGPPLGNVANNVPNPSANAALPYSILGTNPAIRDCMTIVYPVVQATGQLPGVILAQVSGTLGLRGRDPGFPLNMDVAYVVPIDETTLQSDGQGGVTASGDEWVARVCAFAAALGVTRFGVTGHAYVLPVEHFLPDDGGVNTTGAVRVHNTDGVVVVAYPGASRQFDSALREIDPVQ